MSSKKELDRLLLGMVTQTLEDMLEGVGHTFGISQNEATHRFLRLYCKKHGIKSWASESDDDDNEAGGAKNNNNKKDGETK